MSMLMLIAALISLLGLSAFEENDKNTLNTGKKQNQREYYEEAGR